MEIKVSVIIPIYNMEKYLKDCLDSVLKQTLKEIEIICIDDGSVDGTHAILMEYSRKYPNIVVLYQEREGAGGARNKGIEFAKGQFVAFMDSDDYYPSCDVLETLFRGAVANDVKAAGGSYLRNSEGKIYSDFGKLRKKQIFEEEKVIEFSEYQYCYGYTRFIYSSRMLKERKIMFPSYVRNQDPIFMLKALSYADKIWVTPKSTYVARVFDKKLNFNSTRVIQDVAKGIYDIIHFSKEHNYVNLVENMVLELQKWKVFFFIHILSGNQDLYHILRKMDLDIVDSKIRKGSGYYLDESMEGMKEYIENYTLKVREYIQRMEKYEGIVIYGAGDIGKSVFDFIEQREELKFDGFAVSSDKPEGTARGRKINSIRQYLDKRDKTLLVIAGEKRISDEMEKNAEKLGFKNRLTINEKIIDAENFVILNDKFAI